MRILLLTPQFYPQRSGLSNSAYNLSKTLTSIGHTVSILTLTNQVDTYYQLQDPQYLPCQEKLVSFLTTQNFEIS